MPPVIAIDGPSAAGKGTLADGLSERLGYGRLESGILYRATAFEMLAQNLELADETTAARIAAGLVLDKPRDLRQEEVGIAASKIAAHKKVRDALLELQRNFGANPTGGKGSVIDGRDIGTVVFPHTPYKIYLTASDEERANRRLAQLGLPASRLGQIKADLIARDKQDRQRAVAPLRSASDAHRLDSSAKPASQVLAEALAYLATKGLS